MLHEKTRPAAEAEPGTPDTESIVRGLAERGRAAMEAIAGAPQERLDEIVTALAWSLYEPGRARALAELAVETTGLGNAESKVIKNQRKTFGTLRDLLRVKSTGVIEELPEKGLVKYAPPPRRSTRR
jgi:sulfoacetaldehyde dehydrogenase